MQYKYDPKVEAVRVNGQNTEVKQPRPWIILRCVTIWHPQCFFFGLAEILDKLGKFASLTGISRKTPNIKGMLCYNIRIYMFFCVQLNFIKIYILLVFC